ncbi:MAG: NAD(+)/NADH kinase [Deltaproteobacteria bacterium]|nr:NAD(+)/NADH kinase [Deltaproteobacteria bacterium]
MPSVMPIGHRVGDAVAPSRIAVVKKSSAIEQLQAHPDARMQRALQEGQPVAHRVTQAHREHVASVDAVVAALTERGLQFRVVSALHRRVADWADLVVTVGGDGTFLSASHAIRAGDRGDGPPMLGVNSATSSSIGYFCATDGAGFGALVDQLAARALHSQPLWRMQVSVNGEPLGDLALNDVLLAHKVPAETTRYQLELQGVVQDHKSSGIWVATAAGSTAAIRSAGGAVLPIDSPLLQYRVRELMTWAVSGEPLAGGTFDSDLTVTSRMLAGALYIDGSHLKVGFGYGDRITFRPAPRPLGWIAPPGFEQRRAAIVAGSSGLPN